MDIIETQWRVNRINLHGKVDDLSSDFELNGKIFSAFINPKSGETGEVVVLSLRLMGEEDNAPMTPCPIVTGDWCPLSIVMIGANASILDDYDIYWGRGS